VTEPGESLRVRELRFASAQVVRHALAAQEIAHAMAKNRRVDRLGEEVGGACVIRAFDRRDVVQPGHHQDGNVLATLGRANGRAHLEAVHARHLHVQEHHVRRGLAKPRKPAGTVFGLEDGEFGLLEGITCDDPLEDAVVDDQNPRLAVSTSPRRQAACSASATRSRARHTARYSRSTFASIAAA
jgi:hypothetical protein